MAGEHAGHRQRMRERFLAGGLEGFADHEVLELMLFYAIPQRNVNPLAHRLLDRFGTLHAVLEAPVEELMKVEGVGQYAALLLSLVDYRLGLLLGVADYAVLIRDDVLRLLYLTWQDKAHFSRYLVYLGAVHKALLADGERSRLLNYLFKGCDKV